ncbi:transcription factor bHLH100 [Sesamum indicum]|uniref:Transcription factor bHLH100 n=1 Tax=Sesamum indicum TaxID=4182 RepID=A0A6I9TVK4_SESIN|nr:transcription factor bHLH100 [Sesamum indicum]
MPSTSPIADPLNDIESPEFLSPFDDSWPLYQEILRQTWAPADRDETVNTEIHSNRMDHEAATMIMNSADVVDHVDEQQPILDKGLELMKIRCNPKNSKTRRSRSCKLIRNNNERSTTAGMEQSAEEGPSDVVAKKLDHNAKERIRRMKLNASYLALRSLLPDSRRSKKRWSAPAIVERVVKYIPELENEVEALRSKKDNIVQQSSTSKKKIASAEHQNLTVCVNKINQEEAVVQVCMGSREDDEDGEVVGFTNLLQAVEDDEGICNIKSASTVDVCESRICCHLHIQVNQSSSEAEGYIEELKDKIISRLI